MARRYHAHEPEVVPGKIATDSQSQERISFLIRVEAVHEHLD